MSQASRGCCKSAFTVFAVAGLLAACATTDGNAPPELRPAEARRTVATLHASGVQIYQCKRAPDGKLSWVFKAPEAELRDDAGRVVVKHDAGPSWEATDGSKVTGKMLAQAANTKAPGSIALLLLQATNAGGPGMLGSVRYVQRLNTQGGVAPPAPCAQEGQESRIPYRADYVFLE
jgi:hypothetical protein